MHFRDENMHFLNETCFFLPRGRGGERGPAVVEEAADLLVDVSLAGVVWSRVLSWAGLLIQIWSSAFSLFPAFDFVFPFPHTARFPFFPGKKRENGFR